LSTESRRRNQPITADGTRNADSLTAGTSGP
jgi:hypothetical protein